VDGDRPLDQELGRRRRDREKRGGLWRAGGQRIQDLAGNVVRSFAEVNQLALRVGVLERMDERRLPADEKGGDEKEMGEALHYLTGVASTMR
jgi:hypothetical protein